MTLGVYADILCVCSRCLDGVSCVCSPISKPSQPSLGTLIKMRVNMGIRVTAEARVLHRSAIRTRVLPSFCIVLHHSPSASFCIILLVHRFASFSFCPRSVLVLHRLHRARVLTRSVCSCSDMFCNVHVFFMWSVFVLVLICVLHVSVFWIVLYVCFDSFYMIAWDMCVLAWYICVSVWYTWVSAWCRI